MENLKENTMWRELNPQEMKEVNGGFPWGLIVKYALRGGEVLLTVTGVADLADRFTDGWEEAGDSKEFK